MYQMGKLLHPQLRLMSIELIGTDNIVKIRGKPWKLSEFSCSVSRQADGLLDVI